MPLVVLCCDASPAIGYGHLVRSLALARELADRGCNVTFAIGEDEGAGRRVDEEGFSFRRHASAEHVVEAVSAMTRLGALVLDLPVAVPRAALDRLRTRVVIVATIDDATDSRLSADLAFYPPVPQVEDFDWTGFSGARLSGWDWIVLRRAFAESPARPERSRPTVLVTMGGSDPGGLTLTAAAALAMLSEPFGVRIVLGPGYHQHAELQRCLLELKRPAILLEKPADMRAVMLDADVAVASFGVTAYELAATATPAIYLCLTADHARSASILEAKGAAIVVGVHRGDEAPVVAEALQSLLADSGRRQQMGRTGRDLVDGRGAARVADRILTEIDRKHDRS